MSVCETRAQARTRSIAATGFTRKSATRICSSVRATFSSKLCVTATTGGQALHARHQPRQRLHFRVAAGVEIDHHDGGARGIERVAVLRDPARHDGKFDRVAGAERGARRTIELRVGGEHHHAGPICIGIGTAA